ncbi:MAG: type I restriction-modification enzyme R subunit C-terminal domain-containing protein [Opitutales bacterium]
MNRSAAQRLFSIYLADRTLTTAQIRFIETIIDQLTARGIIEPSALYEPPFNGFHDEGPEGLFANKGNIIEGVFTVLNELQSRLQAQGQRH